MTDFAHFSLDFDDAWREYQSIRRVAAVNHLEACETARTDPRGAQVNATLAVAARLEAIGYLLSKMKVY